MGSKHYFVLRQGGWRIFVTSLHFTTKKHPCLYISTTYMHANTPTQYCWQPWSSGLPVAMCRSSLPAPSIYFQKPLFAPSLKLLLERFFASIWCPKTFNLQYIFVAVAALNTQGHSWTWTSPIQSIIRRWNLLFLIILSLNKLKSPQY